MSNLLEKASIITTPTAYNNGKLLSVKGGTPADFDFTRLGTGATRVNSSGLIESVASGLPRIDYTDGVGSILLEPQSTNLYLNSETLSTQNNSTTASSYTVSFYGTGTINLTGAFVGSLVGTGVNDRVSLTFTSTLSTLTSTISGSVNKAQLEQQSFATSYIPTTTQTATRNAEKLNNAGSSDLINSTEGVLYAETKASVHNGKITLSNGTNNENLIIGFNLSSGRIDVNMKVGGDYQFIFNYTADMYLNHKIAVRYKANDFALFVDGTKVLTDTYGITPTSGTLKELNFAAANQEANIFYGNTKCVAVFKEALTDAELTQLTTI